MPTSSLGICVAPAAPAVDSSLLRPNVAPGNRSAKSSIATDRPTPQSRSMSSNTVSTGLPTVLLPSTHRSTANDDPAAQSASAAMKFMLDTFT
jgi:hypothetical protein